MDFKVEGITIGTVLNAKRRFTAQKMVNTTLDGTVYIQSTGKPISRYEVYVYCGTPEDRNSLDKAANESASVTITLRDGAIVTGYIEEDEVTWREWIDGHGVGSLTIIATEINEEE